MLKGRMCRIAVSILAVHMTVLLASSVAFGEAPAPASPMPGKVDAQRPAGPGWQCEDRRVEEGTPVQMTKCRRDSGGEFLIMMAKEYVVGSAEVVPAKALLLEEYQAQYRRMFDDVRYVSDRVVKRGKLVGHEAVIDARHSKRGAIHKVERVFVVGRRVFNVSAEGNPDDFKTHRQVINRWLESARFENLP
jgi:hypothetical protein